MADFSNKVIYQIYPKSFKDSNGDGIGDLRGVAEKLDYLKDLGVDYLWLTPFFVSPQRDNGYDVADYRNIDPMFGTMEDLDNLIAEGEKRNIGLMFDIVSRFGNEGEYWKESAKMLAGMIHLMRGTPYIYQGEEIGMTNPHYTSIEQYADVESRNYYEILLNEGKTKEEALEILAARSRDNSRTPMQWTDERYCGFSDTKPWIPVSDNFEKINVKKQKQDRDSILEFYKKLIMLRKEKEVIARGNIEFMEVENAGVLAYTRCLDKQKLLVCCNFRDVESQMEFTQEWKSGRKILGNYEENHKNNYKVLTLRPYEIIVLEKGEE